MKPPTSYNKAAQDLIDEFDRLFPPTPKTPEEIAEEKETLFREILTVTTTYNC